MNKKVRTSSDASGLAGSSVESTSNYQMFGAPPMLASASADDHLLSSGTSDDYSAPSKSYGTVVPYYEHYDVDLTCFASYEDQELTREWLDTIAYTGDEDLKFSDFVERQGDIFGPPDRA